MDTFEKILMKYEKIYMLGAASSTSRKLIKMMEQAGREFTEIWDEVNTELTSRVINNPENLSEIKDGIVIIAVEQRYLSKWTEACRNYLNVEYADGFELVYSEIYQECKNRGTDNMLERCKSCKASIHSCPNRRAYYNNTRKKTIKQLAFKAGFICNLKCKYCCEFLPYFKKEHIVGFNVDDYKKDLKKLSDACEYIHILSFSGGDAMLNTGMAQLIDYATSIENIGDIYILTNGTYIPNDTVLESLERNKERVHIVINDYEINNKAHSLVDELKKRDVLCNVRPNAGWYDFTDLSFKNRTDEELKEIYRNCSFDATETSYYIYCNGKVTMRCGVANGIMHYLNLYDECKDEYADVRNTPVNMLADELDRIDKKGFVKMCNYCTSCKVEERVLQPAKMQLSKS